MDDSSNPLMEGDLDEADKDGFSLIDGSELEDLFVSMSGDMGDNKVNMVDGPVRAEKPRKNEKCNLRKSLAWDSAFFTSAGVLDAEELSTIMEGGNGGKHQLQHLPGIQEDVSRSTDSLSTLGSDNLTLESLEADLFTDIRASIQRSGKKTSETKHGNMVKPKPTPKKIMTNLQGTAKLVKLGSSREQVRKPVGSRKEPTSCLPKQAVASAKGSTTVMTPGKVSTKRMSISAGRVKSDNSHPGSQMAAGRVPTVPKGDRPGGPRSVIPKGGSHAKSSSVSSTIPKGSSYAKPSSVSSTIPKGSSYAKPSSVSSTNTRTGVSSTRSSVDSTSSSSSQSSRILPLNGVQGKTTKPASVSRIPSRVPLKTKNPPTSSRIMTKLSASTLSSVSPTSSISEWSSCSSNVTANQEHSASTDCSTLHRTFSLDSNASQDLPSQQGFCGDEEVASAGNVSVSNPVSAKPSGLRMPSPKIGFFDGVKSGSRTQNAVGSKQCRLSSSRLPRSTSGNSSPGGVPNRGKAGNVNVKPTALAGQSTKSNVTSSEGLTKTTSLITNGESNSRVAKLPVGEKQHLSARKKSTTPQGKSQSLSKQVSSASEADLHMKEINKESIEPDTLLLDKLIKSEEVGNASKVNETAKKCKETSEGDDTCIVINVSAEEAEINTSEEADNTDTSVQNEECQAHNEKNDALFAEINTSEEADNADTVVLSQVRGGCQAHNEKNAALFAEINTAEEAGNADTVVLSQVPGGCDATNEKNDDPICAVNNISEDVSDDENTDTRVQSGVYEATTEKIDPLSGENNVLLGDEKNDPICAVNNISEEVHNDQNAVAEVQSRAYEATNKKIDSLCGEDYADTVLLSDEKNDPLCAENNISEEVCNDENADTRVQSGVYVATTEKIDPLSGEDNVDTVLLGDEKNDPICAVNNISEEVHNDQSAVAEVQSRSYEATNEKIETDTVLLSDEKNDPLCTVNNISEEVCNDENAETRVQSGVYVAPTEKIDQLSGEDNVDTVLLSDEKNDPICAVNNISEEVHNDQNAGAEVQSRVYEATNEKIDPLCEEVKADTVLLSVEKNDPICAVNNISEEVHNDQNADAEVQIDPLCGEENADTVLLSEEKIDPMCFGINMFEEVHNDQNADVEVQSGVYEATNEKNDPLFREDNADTALLSSEKNDPMCSGINMFEEAHSDQNAGIKNNPLCTSINISEAVGNAINITDNSDTVSSTVELSGLNEEENAENFHKPTDTCLSSKISESKPCVRTPFADKNSSPGKFSLSVLVKRFNSLSLDNIQAKNV